jgi:hypothetical protein
MARPVFKRAMEKGSGMSLLWQMLLAGILAAYLWQCRRSMRQRNLRSWESLLDRLRFYPNAFGSDEPSTLAERLAAISGQLRQRPRNFSILWASFRCSGIALELIDHAERNIGPGDLSIDPAQLTSMRRDAMQIRISAVASLAARALSGSTN